MRGYVCICWRLTHQCFGDRWHTDDSGMGYTKNERILFGQPPSTVLEYFLESFLSFASKASWTLNFGTREFANSIRAVFVHLREAQRITSFA